MSHRNLVNYRGHHDWEVIKAIRLWLEPRHRPAGVCGRKWVQIATGTQTFFLSHARLWHHEHNIFLSSSLGAESGFHYLTPNQPYIIAKTSHASHKNLSFLREAEKYYSLNALLLGIRFIYTKACCAAQYFFKCNVLIACLKHGIISTFVSAF